jgi:hypothetical protein
MIARTINKLRSALLGAAAAALILTTTTALAGSGVGGVFNLGQVNTVDAQTVLTGNPGGNPELKVTSTGTAAAVRGVANTGIGTNGVSTSGVGQQGLSNSGIGTLGTHGNATGVSPGVQGETNSTDPAGAGVVGKNNGGGPGLKAIVNAGAPPLAVNSTAKVANLNADLLDGLDASGLPYWKLGGNAGTTPGTNFLGTTDNQALELKVNGQRALRLEPTTGGFGIPASPNLIGGPPGNSVDTGRVGAVIAGGGSTLTGTNHVYNDYDFIGAGFDNRTGTAGGNVASAVVAGTHNAAPAGWAFIGGGDSNSAVAEYDFVGAGANNTAGSATGGGASAIVAGTGNIAPGGSAFVGAGGVNRATADYAFVGAGQFNSADGGWSAVPGGYYNLASGEFSYVAGGYGNTASGNQSFAAGTQAKATQYGSFVWGDGNFAEVTSPDTDTFTVRASGGIWLGACCSTPAIGVGHFIDTSTGAFLTSSGTWTNNSDRAKKHDFRPLSTKHVLATVARIPITSWSYKAENPSIRHIGPMARTSTRPLGSAWTTSTSPRLTRGASRWPRSRGCTAITETSIARTSRSIART